MSKMKSLDIRLTDIWIECEKEMIQMRNKLNYSNDCLEAIQLINKHLVKCNESLVSIIEKCDLDCDSNEHITQLIDCIREEEKSIDKWKKKLQSIKCQNKDNYRLNDENIIKISEKWRKCKPIKCLTYDKSCQTEKCFEDFLIDCGKKVINTDNTVSPTVTEEEIKQEIDLISTNCQMNSQISKMNDNSVNGHKVSDSEDQICCLEEDKFSVSDSTDDDWKVVNKNKKKSQKSTRNRKKRIKKSSRIAKKVLVEKTSDQMRQDEWLQQFRVDKLLVCKEPDCDFTIGVKKTFLRHLRKHEKQRNKIKIDLDNPRPYPCDWPGCDMRFKCSSHLREHKLRHMNYKPYECDWPGCGFKMAKRFDVLMHKRTHTKEKPLNCDWPGCEYHCNAQWSLVAHKRKHTGEKPYQCVWPDCNYRCSQPGTLILHRRKHTGEKPYICNVPGCLKRFSVLAGLHLHRPVHEKELKNSNNKVRKSSAKKLNTSKMKTTSID